MTAKRTAESSAVKLRHALVREIERLAQHGEVKLRSDAVGEMAERLRAVMRLTGSGGIADAGGKTLLFYLTTIMKEQAGHLYAGVGASPNGGEPNVRLFGDKPSDR